ncbi:MAG: hypothetical protein QM680_13660 [Luteolibacter sp.]
MDNVVLIDDLPSFVSRTLLGIREGVALARNSGNFLAELPEDVQFDVVVIQDWQKLEILGGQTTESTESQGGGQTEVSNRNESGQQIRTGTDHKEETSSGEDSETSTQTSTQTTEGEESRNTSGTDTSNGTVADAGREDSQNNNAHNQSSSGSSTYTE